MWYACIDIYRAFRHESPTMLIQCSPKTSPFWWRLSVLSSDTAGFTMWNTYHTWTKRRNGANCVKEQCTFKTKTRETPWNQKTIHRDNAQCSLNVRCIAVYHPHLRRLKRLLPCPEFGFFCSYCHSHTPHQHVRRLDNPHSYVLFIWKIGEYIYIHICIYM